MSKTLEALNNMDNTALIGHIEGRMSFDGYTEAQAIAYVASDFAAELRKNAPMLDEDGEDIWDDDEILDYTTELWTDSRKAALESIVEEYGLGSADGCVALAFDEGNDLIIWKDEQEMKAEIEATKAIFRKRLTKIDWKLLQEMGVVDTYEDWLDAQ